MKSDDCESSFILSKALSAPSLAFNQKRVTVPFLLLFGVACSVTLGKT